MQTICHACTPDWRAPDILLAAIGLWHCCVTSSLLSAVIPPPVIRQVNLDFLLVEKRDASAKMRARGLYGRLTDKQQAQISKYASENGNAAAVRRFSKELNRPLNGSTVRSIKKNYYQLQHGIYFAHDVTREM